MGSSLYAPEGSAKDTMQGSTRTTDYSPAVGQSLSSVQANQGNATGAQQAQLAQALRDQYNGQGVNLGQTQLQQALQQAQSNTASNVASQRGQNAGTGARLALQNSAGQTQQMAGQSAIERQQQQLAAQQQLAGVLQGQRGADIYQQAANTSNATAIGGLQNNQNSTAVTSNLGANAQNQQAAEFNAKTNQEMLGAGIGAAGSIAGSGTTLMSAHGGEVPHLSGGGFGDGMSTGSSAFAGAGKASGGSGGLSSIMGGGGGGGAMDMLAAMAHGGSAESAVAKAILRKHGPQVSGRLAEALRRQMPHLDGGGFLTGMGAGAESFAGAGKATAGKSNSPASGGSPDEGSDVLAPSTPVSQQSDPMGIGMLQSPTGDQGAPPKVGGDPFGVDGSGAASGSLGAGGKTASSFGNSSQLSSPVASSEFAHGGVSRFSHLVHSLAQRPDVHDPRALAAAIGRKKYGPAKFAGMARKADGGGIDFRSGGHVPGNASVAGDSYANDTVPAMLSPKEIVIPRSITTKENAPQNAARFVAALLRSRGRKAQ